MTLPMTPEELTSIAMIRDDKGLVLKTANGLEAYIQRSDGDREAPASDLIDLAFEAFAMEKRIADLENTMRKAADIIDRNLYRQSEKVEDAAALLRAALG